MATTNAGAFNVSRIGITINTDGSMAVVLSYTNASTGAGVVTRILTVPADTSKAITDQLGNVVANPVPAALATAISSFLTQVDTSIANGASGNKLNL